MTNLFNSDQVSKQNLVSMVIEYFRVCMTLCVTSGLVFCVIVGLSGFLAFLLYY